MKYTRRLCLLNVSSILLALGLGSGHVNRSFNQGTCARSDPCKCIIRPDNTEVSCKRRPLTRIPDDLPSNTIKLDIFEVPFESHTLHRANLSRYSGLKHLQLGDCGLEVVDADAFADLSNLEWLDIGMNDIKVIQPNTFSGLNLQVLALSYNPNLKLSRGAFQGLKVQGLALHNSAIKELNPEDFLPLRSSLVHLSVNNISVEELPRELESLFSSLDNLDIALNPLKCDCNMRWFKEFYDANPKKFWWKPRCGSPAELKGTSLKEITAEDFKCAKYSKWARMMMH